MEDQAPGTISRGLGSFVNLIDGQNLSMRRKRSRSFASDCFETEGARRGCGFRFRTVTK